jgi:translation initiation factor IF-1
MAVVPLVADTENIDDNKGRIVWRCLNGEAL